MRVVIHQPMEMKFLQMKFLNVKAAGKELLSLCVLVVEISGTAAGNVRFVKFVTYM